MICLDCFSDNVSEVGPRMYKCEECGLRFAVDEGSICPSCGENTFGSVNFYKDGPYIYCTECGYDERGSRK